MGWLEDLVYYILMNIWQYINDLSANLVNWMAQNLTNFFNWMSSIISNVVTWFTNQLNSLITWITQLWSTVSNFLNNLLVTLANKIDVIMNSIGNAINALLNGVYNAVTWMINTVSDALSSVVNTIQNALGEIIQYIANKVVEVFDAVKNTITAFWNTIEEFFVAAVSYVQAFIENVVAWVQSLVAAATSVFTQAASFLWNAIHTGIAQLMSLVIATIQQITQIVSESIGAILNSTTGLIAGIAQKLGDVVTGFKDAATTVSAALADLGAESIGAIGDWIKTVAQLYEGFFDDASKNTMNDLVEQITSPNTLALKTRAQAADFWHKIYTGNPVMSHIFKVALSIFVFTSVYSGMVQGSSAMILQEWAKEYPWQILGAGDAVQLWRRDEKYRSLAMEELGRAGYDLERRDALLESTFSPPDPGEVIQMMLRGIIDDTTMRKWLRWGGVSQESIEPLLGLAEYIPSPSDLITISVKEGFNDEFASRTGTDAEFPAEFQEWAAKQGLSEFWCRRYWRAHWDLPSATQGYEMLHRGLITEDELDMLLKALDYAPGWRSKMRDISYNVLTRVDIRRIHAKLGKSRQWLIDSHRALGYSPSDAELLSDFVEALNGEPDPGDVDELGKLTRSAILGFFEDGLLDRTRAKALLIDAGSTAQAADLYLDAKEYDSARKERAAQVSAIIDLTAAGVFSFEEAQGELTVLGLTEIETQRALAKLQRTYAQKTKLPTVEQGLKMYQTGVILEPDLTELLQRLGYSSKWVTAFVAMAKAKG